ncbi:hypothetical protein K4G22_16205 [Streptomyces profundus]|nr:hypothetical protein K4G22_16205 [Streptomyces sp. MA3_2.13]
MVISVDACGSGRLAIDAKKSLRRAMYRAFEEAGDAVGVLPGELRKEDRGDGILATVEPSVPQVDLVGRWVETLRQGVREHNRAGGVPLRLRVAMHAGPVVIDAEGLVGRAVDLTCRLCDSEAAKRAIDEAGADFLLVVSDPLYRTVVREGGRYIEPDDYVPHRVGNKETDETAWFLLPGRRDRQGPAPDRAGTTAPRARGQVFQVAGDNQVFSDNVFQGPFTGIAKAPAKAPEDDGRGPA